MAVNLIVSLNLRSLSLRSLSLRKTLSLSLSLRVSLPDQDLKVILLVQPASVIVTWRKEVQEEEEDQEVRAILSPVLVIRIVRI